MNERIRQLAIEAGLEMCSCGCDMPTRQSAKFAELIVQECLVKIKVWEQDSRNHISYLLKQHFGIEQ